MCIFARMKQKSDVEPCALHAVLPERGCTRQPTGPAVQPRAAACARTCDFYMKCTSCVGQTMYALLLAVREAAILSEAGARRMQSADAIIEC